KKGTILETHATVGQVLPVGSLLVVIETEGGAAVAAAPAQPAPAPAPAAKPAPAPAAALQAVAPASPKNEPAATAVGDIKDTLPGAGFFDKLATKGANGASGHGHGEVITERPLATPATRQLARELEIDLRFVPGTGPGGRITSDDVKRFASAGAARDAAPAPAAAPSAPAPASGPIAAKGGGRAPVAIAPPAGTATALEERKPFVGMRRK